MTLVSRTLARFDAKVMPIPESGCHVWVGHIDRGGYGRFKENGRAALAHRVAWFMAGRGIPDGMELDHKCRIRSCVNPDHLEPVTRRENINRGICRIVRAANQRKQSAARTHCSKGHLLAGGNLYLRKSGTRRCRTCQLALAKANHAKRRQIAIAKAAEPQ